MKKMFGLYAGLWAFFLVLFNVVSIVVPFIQYGYGNFIWTWQFFVKLVLINLSFYGHLACSIVTFLNKNANKRFLNMPLFTFSLVGLGAIVFFSFIMRYIPIQSTLFDGVACLAVAIVTLVAIFKAKMAAVVVNEVEEKVAEKTTFIKSITVDAEILMSSASSDELRAECKKVYEALRYSDPMSNNGLKSVEDLIGERFSELSSAVKANEIENSANLADEIVALVDSRNKRCRSLK